MTVRQPSHPPRAAEGFSWSEEPCGPVLRCRALGESSRHFFTARLADRGVSGCEWADIAAAAGVEPGRVMRLRQVHGAQVVAICRDAFPPEAPDGDALIGDDPETALAVLAADCVPVLLADVRTGAVGAVHAGWRGTAAGVAAAVVGAMRHRFATRPADLVVSIGPSIGPCCYDVGEEVRAAFRQAGHASRLLDRWFAAQPAGTLRLDLWRATADQLAAVGVPPERIYAARLCTATHSAWFPSYRRQGRAAGRLAGVIRPLAKP